MRGRNTKSSVSPLYSEKGEKEGNGKNATEAPAKDPLYCVALSNLKRQNIPETQLTPNGMRPRFALSIDQEICQLIRILDWIDLRLVRLKQAKYQLRS